MDETQLPTQDRTTTDLDKSAIAFEALQCRNSGIYTYSYICASIQPY